MTPPDLERNKSCSHRFCGARRPKQLRFTANFLRRHSKTKRGAIGSPFCVFGAGENHGPAQRWVQMLRPSIVEYDVRVGAKLCCGGAASPSADDGAGRATRRDSWFEARQGARSSGQA
jgi:hypothetical protein